MFTSTVAIELNQRLVELARFNLKRNNVHNAIVHHMASEEFSNRTLLSLSRRVWGIDATQLPHNDTVATCSSNTQNAGVKRTVPNLHRDQVKSTQAALSDNVLGCDGSVAAADSALSCDGSEPTDCAAHDNKHDSTAGVVVSGGVLKLDRGFDAILLDPPRAGLDARTVELAAGVDHVLMISCNQTELERTLAVLCGGDEQDDLDSRADRGRGKSAHTHTVCRFAFFDHFPFTAHTECAVWLTRRSVGSSGDKGN